ncbi:hypothetical protein PVAP13_7NG194200 [Panicum virgatum]|uniref:Uncharacterized protein n=1 Tax=Panicum virgatum TaxID=38727 RepID=A0A8T0PVC2_PANVG|nr:hypothetical protein PVAP13_7NG194200 [Panicum virgatum]
MATARKMERDRRGGRAGARRYQPCDGQPDQRLDRDLLRGNGRHVRVHRAHVLQPGRAAVGRRSRGPPRRRPCTWCPPSWCRCSGRISSAYMLRAPLPPTSK